MDPYDRTPADQERIDRVDEILGIAADIEGVDEVRDEIQVTGI